MVLPDCSIHQSSFLSSVTKISDFLSDLALAINCFQTMRSPNFRYGSPEASFFPSLYPGGTSAAYLFVQRPLPMDEKAKALLNDEGKAALAGLIPALLSSTEWTAHALEAVVKSHAETTGLKLGKLAQPLRAALTGTSTSPGIFDVLEVLGKAESLGRIEDQAAG